MRCQSSESQFVKAEAQYNLCYFEHALVTYYRGRYLYIISILIKIQVGILKEALNIKTIPKMKKLGSNKSSQDK